MIKMGKKNPISGTNSFKLKTWFLVNNNGSGIINAEIAVSYKYFMENS